MIRQWRFGSATDLTFSTSQICEFFGLTEGQMAVIRQLIWQGGAQSDRVEIYWDRRSGPAATNPLSGPNQSVDNRIPEINRIAMVTPSTAVAVGFFSAIGIPLRDALRINAAVVTSGAELTVEYSIERGVMDWREEFGQQEGEIRQVGDDLTDTPGDIWYQVATPYQQVQER